MHEICNTSVVNWIKVVTSLDSNDAGSNLSSIYHFYHFCSFFCSFHLVNFMLCINGYLNMNLAYAYESNTHVEQCFQ